MITILGAGLSGCSLARFLSEKGANLTLIEKNNEPGGLLESVSINGFTFDTGGSHIIFSKNKEILDYMVRILGNNIVKCKRNTKILYKGRYVKYPFENGLADLPSDENYECLRDYIRTFINKTDTPTNLKEWCYYTFGKAISEKYLIPYNEKIWKYSCEKLSTIWVERIPKPPLEDVIKSSLGIETEGYTHQLYFYYPKFGGIFSLLKAIYKPIENKILTNTKIKEIKKEDGKWIVKTNKNEITSDKIVSTIPIHELINYLKDIPQSIKSTVKNLKFNSLVTIAIGIDTPKINNLSWLYIPNKDILPHRVSFPSNYSKYVVPNRKSSVLAEITFKKRDKISKMKKTEIVERTIEELHNLKIINKKEVTITEIFVHKYAYIVPDINYPKNIKIIHEFFKKYGIYLLGRFSRFTYINMDQAIKEAKNLSKNLTILTASTKSSF